MDFVTTLPNILKEFRPDLIGFSAEQADPLEESLNVAFSGATTAATKNQTLQLVERIRNHPSIDFDRDWKLVTIFMGYNDVCDFACVNNSLELVDDWVDNIDQALEYLRDNLPRTFVNLMLLASINNVREYIKVAPRCTFFVQRVCPCVLNTGAAAMNEMVVDQFNEKLNRLVASRKYDVSNDFTVVVQPFLSNSQPFRDENGTVDISSAAIDCVHLSATGNRLFSAGLWKNMLQSVGAKDTEIGDEPPVCPPQAFPYFYTYLNSASE